MNCEDCEMHLNRFAFISRHTPTREQMDLARTQSIELVCVGDADAFTVSPAQYSELDGVVVVHPAAALRLASHFIVGVFENENRAPVGEKPEFFARALHLYDLRQP